MTFNRNQNTVNKVVGAIAATAFLSISAILPQAAFSQSSPGVSGDPRVDEPSTRNRVDDPSRPATNNTNQGDMNQGDMNQGGTVAPANSTPARGGVYSNPSGQRNDSGFGGGAGGGNFDQSGPAQPANRIERYSQPGATDPSRSTEYLPPANSTEEGETNSNTQMNNSGFGGGTGGTGSTESIDRGNDRYTAPNSNLPGSSTYSNPSAQQINRTSGPNSGNIDNQINNSTSPGSATPGSGSSNYNNDRSNINNSGGSNVNSGSNVNNGGSGIDNSGSNTGGGAGGTGAVQGLW